MTVNPSIYVGWVGNSGNLGEVDPSFLATRMSLRPLDWAVGNIALSHWRCALVSGTTVSISAGGILASLRYAGSYYLVPIRIQVSVAVSSAITAATVADLQAFIFRGSTGNATGGSTGTPSLLRKTMVLNTANYDLRVASTGALTAASGKTNDASPFASACFQTLQSVTATGTATAGAVGTASPKVDLYRLDAPGVQHPIILSPNEGIEIQEVTAGPVTGGLKFYIDVEAAEVSNF